MSIREEIYILHFHFFTGNHDLWCGDYLTKECGVMIHRESLTTEIFGKEFYHAHGDGLGDPDKKFKMLRAMFLILLCDRLAGDGGAVLHHNHFKILETLLQSSCQLYPTCLPTVEELKSDHIPEGTYTTGIDGSLMKGGAEEHIGVKDGKLNINTATVEQLMALSGIGESKAKSIVEDRAKNGLFSSIEDITRVSGIGEAMFNKIKDDITVN